MSVRTQAEVEIAWRRRLLHHAPGSAAMGRARKERCAAGVTYANIAYATSLRKVTPRTWRDAESVVIPSRDCRQRRVERGCDSS